MTNEPRETGLLEPRAIGEAIVRRDAELKVRGTATYAYETPVEHPAYAQIVQATVARGRVTGVDTAAADRAGGVLAVLTSQNAERLASADDRELAVLQSAEVAFRGQPVALVVAETSEAARRAADLVRVSYDEQPHDVELRTDRDDLYKPEKVNPANETDTVTGDVAAAMASAPVTLDRTYTTAMYHNNPLEPHATTALWEPGADVPLTLWDSTQGVHPARSAVAKVFGLEEPQVRVVCPFVGGGFGSKGTPHAHAVLAAMAARAVPGRPVKLALTRQQMFFLAGYRTPTIQRMQLAADQDGRLTAIAIDVVEQTSRIKEFAEQTALPTRMMYAAPNRRTTHRLAALDVPVPSWMRAPGECPGMFGPEVALDELAGQLGIDPIELRIRNEPAADPESGKPWSSRHLVECLREGAQRFGWHDRDPRPGVRREGDWLVGTGVAAAVYPTMRQAQSCATVRFEEGRYVAEIGAADLGTGAWTVLPQIAADALGVPAGNVEVRIGDTRYPVASVAGGSSGTNTWGSAIVVAARAFRDKFGSSPSDGDEATGDVSQAAKDEEHAAYAFGAQFAEARVHADTAEIRVPRLLGVFAAGRIINPRTARSQFTGGMTMGLSMALHEASIMDPRLGEVVNHDLAEYHIAANADVTSVEAYWLDEYDPYVNVMGSKGIGEIGIVGTAAAVANAVHHATGVRVRDLPVTLDKLLSALPLPTGGVAFPAPGKKAGLAAIWPRMPECGSGRNDRVDGAADVIADFNQGLAPGDAQRRLHALDDQGLYWFEEPLTYTDLAGHARLTARLRTPVQLGENFYGPEALAAAVRQRACGYVMPDLMRIGGVTGWLRAAPVAAAAGLQVSAHLYPEVSAHLLRATPAGHWLEWVDWANPVLAEPFRVQDGMLHIPDIPGCGIEWDEQAVTRFSQASR